MVLAILLSEVGLNDAVDVAALPPNDAFVEIVNRLGTTVCGPSIAVDQSCVIAPSGQIVAQAFTTGDELVVGRCDLDWCDRYKKTVFDFDRYRAVEHYGLITSQRGVVAPPDPAQETP